MTGLTVASSTPSIRKELASAETSSFLPGGASKNQLSREDSQTTGLNKGALLLFPPLGSEDLAESPCLPTVLACLRWRGPGRRRH